MIELLIFILIAILGLYAIYNYYKLKKSYEIGIKAYKELKEIDSQISSSKEQQLLYLLIILYDKQDWNYVFNWLEAIDIQPEDEWYYAFNEMMKENRNNAQIS